MLITYLLHMLLFIICNITTCICSNAYLLYYITRREYILLLYYYYYYYYVLYYITITAL